MNLITINSFIIFILSSVTLVLSITREGRTNPPYKLWKKHLKIVTIRQPPFYFPSKSSNNANVGFIADLLGVMFKDENVTFDLYTLDPRKNINEKFALSNRTNTRLNASTPSRSISQWQIVIKEVTEGRADMIAAPLTIMPERMKHLKFSFPFMPANVVVLVRKPTKPGQKMLFRYLKELPWLSVDKKLVYGVMKGGATEAMLKDSSYQMYQDMYQQLKLEHEQGHKVFLDSYQAGLQQVRNDTSGKFVFIGDEVFLEYASSRAPCDTMVWGKPLNTAFYGLAFPRNVPPKFLDFVNQRLLRMQRFGKMRRLKDKWWHPSQNGCEKPKLCVCGDKSCMDNAAAIQGAPKNETIR